MKRPDGAVSARLSYGDLRHRGSAQGTPPSGKSPRGWGFLNPSWWGNNIPLDIYALMPYNALVTGNEQPRRIPNTLPV